MRNNVLEKIVDELISCKIVPEKNKELYAFGIYQGMYNKRRLKTSINKERVENMNGDIKEEAVQVTWKGTEITLKTLKTLVQTFIVSPLISKILNLLEINKVKGWCYMF